jgi:hypothetical protein
MAGCTAPDGSPQCHTVASASSGGRGGVYDDDGHGGGHLHESCKRCSATRHERVTGRFPLRYGSRVHNIGQ